MKKLKKYFKIILITLVFILLTGFIWYFDLVIYGIKQAYGQYKILSQTRPVDKVLKDQGIEDSIKEKIKLVQEVKKFAVDSLGMDENNNYTTFYNQHGKPVLWVVTACKPYQLEAKKWDYAFLGEMEYRGFFNKNEAIKEAQKQAQKGLDTNISTVTAWSTLGWFKDPVLSETLKMDKGELANLIIHELTHQTVFVKDSVALNENLANVIGDIGARRFLKLKYGKESNELKDYLKRMKDYNKYTDFVLKKAACLDSLYKSWSKKEYGKSKKEKKKQLFINEFINDYDTLTFSENTGYEDLFKNNKSINNTFFMHKIRYNRKNAPLDSILKSRFHGDVEKFLGYFKHNYENL